MSLPSHSKYWTEPRKTEINGSHDLALLCMVTLDKSFILSGPQFQLKKAWIDQLLSPIPSYSPIIKLSN